MFFPIAAFCTYVAQTCKARCTSFVEFDKFLHHSQEHAVMCKTISDMDYVFAMT